MDPSKQELVGRRMALVNAPPPGTGASRRGGRSSNERPSKHRMKLLHQFRHIIDMEYADWTLAVSAGDAVSDVFDVHGVAERCMTYEAYLEHREVSNKKGKPVPKEICDRCCRTAVEGFVFQNVLQWSRRARRARSPWSARPSRLSVGGHVESATQPLVEDRFGNIAKARTSGCGATRTPRIMQ